MIGGLCGERLLPLVLHFDLGPTDEVPLSSLIEWLGAQTGSRPMSKGCTRSLYTYTPDRARRHGRRFMSEGAENLTVSAQGAEVPTTS